LLSECGKWIKNEKGKDEFIHTVCKFDEDGNIILKEGEKYLRDIYKY